MRLLVQIVAAVDKSVHFQRDKIDVRFCGVRYLKGVISVFDVFENA